jgi:cell division protein FtsB
LTRGKFLCFHFGATLGLLNPMNVEDSIWDKLTRVVIGLLLLAFLVAIGVWYLPLIRQNERMRREVMRLDAQVQQEAEAKRQLSAAVEALSNDPKAIERLAREKLGYAKPGETVIRFEEATNNAVLPPQ